METWLTSKENDKIWLEATDLNKGDTTLYAHNRSQGRGGGIALMCKSHYKVKLLSKSSTWSFEYTTWMLTIKNRCLIITGIYHPPYSVKNKTTNRMFIDDFTEFSTTLLSKQNNNILIGDFNLHISDDTDPDAAIFMDTCEALGLYQYVPFSTHKSGNTLDLILTKVANRLRVLCTHKGSFISDHALVISQLNVKQQTRAWQSETVHVIKDITSEQWSKAFEEEDLTLSDDFNEMVTGPNSTLRTVLDKLAPEKKVCKSLRSKHPWYTSDLKQHKRRVRKLEKKWLKYKLGSGWIAYKKARNAYYSKLNANKISMLRAKNSECANDSKQLHKLVNNLTAKSVDNPLPPAQSDEDMANMFAEFFEEKILTIREHFQGIPQYKSEPALVPKLQIFLPMTESQMELIVKNMETKSCESDPIPTQVVKLILPTLLPYITKVVNLSLSEGHFHTDWKTAIVRTLLKKIGLHISYNQTTNLPIDLTTHVKPHS